VPVEFFVSSVAEVLVKSRKAVNHACSWRERVCLLVGEESFFVVRLEDR